MFGTNDLKLTKELSERMGDDTINVTTKNRPRFLSWLNPSKQSEAEHPHRRPLMLAQEVARMDPSEQIVLRGGMLPLKTQRACWYNDPNFTALVRHAPEIPRLDVAVAADDGKTRVLCQGSGAKTAYEREKKRRNAATAKPPLPDEGVRHRTGRIARFVARTENAVRTVPVGV